jgi:hypothetical protein
MLKTPEVCIGRDWAIDPLNYKGPEESMRLSLSLIYL